MVTDHVTVEGVGFVGLTLMTGVRRMVFVSHDCLLVVHGWASSAPSTPRMPPRQRGGSLALLDPSSSPYIAQHPELAARVLRQEGAGQGLRKAFFQPLLGAKGAPLDSTACAVEPVDP